MVQNANISFKVTEEQYWTRLFWVSLVIIIVFRVGFLFFSSYNLSPDEAYYWDWSRRLSWGYYSKPPMVAWLIHVFTKAFGDTEFGVRLPATILNSVSLAGIFLLGKRMFSAKTGFFAAAVFFATIGSAVSSIIMTIDAPLLCFWVISMFFFWVAFGKVVERRVNVEQDGLRTEGKLWLIQFFWWIAAAAAAGLGHLSKQTMVGFSLGAFLFLLSSRERRRLFRTPWPYMYFILQLAFLLPVIFWNYHHGWITFEHTAHHFEQGEEGFSFNPSTFFEFIGSQAGIITPITFVLMMSVSICFLIKMVQGKRGRFFFSDPMHGNEKAFLIILGILPLLAITLLSLKQRVNANWPAPFYLSLSILLSAWATEKISCRTRVDSLRNLFKPGLVFGLVLVAVFYFLPVVLQSSGLYGRNIDPTIRLRGWHELGKEAGDLLNGFPDPSRSFVVARRRQTVSELAFYMPFQPVVYRWNGLRRHINSQYEIWSGPVNRQGWDALIVVDKDKGLRKDLVLCFTRVNFIKQIDISLGYGRKRSFLVFRGIRMVHWARR